MGKWWHVLVFDTFWYLNGVLHREDGHAVEWANGGKFWWLNGKKHREDGHAEEWAGGTKHWWLNGKKHRVDGPAEEWSDGGKFWYLNGKKHREDGPAEVWAYGRNAWFLNGKQLVHSKEFGNMKAWFEYLNCNEEESYQLIHDIKGIIGFIDNPSARQIRVHQMAHLL